MTDREEALETLSEEYGLDPKRIEGLLTSTAEIYKARPEPAPTDTKVAPAGPRYLTAPEADAAIARVHMKMGVVDAQQIAQWVLLSPKEDGPTVEPGTDISFRALTQANTSMQVRILAVHAAKAAGGDIKSAKFVFEQAGFKPVAKTEVQITTPRIIDEFGDDRTNNNTIIDVEGSHVDIPDPQIHTTYEPADEDGSFDEDDEYGD